MTANRKPSVAEGITRRKAASQWVVSASVIGALVWWVGCTWLTQTPPKTQRPAAHRPVDVVHATNAAPMPFSALPERMPDPEGELAASPAAVNSAFEEEPIDTNFQARAGAAVAAMAQSGGLALHGIDCRSTRCRVQASELESGALSAAFAIAAQQPDAPWQSLTVLSRPRFGPMAIELGPTAAAMPSDTLLPDASVGGAQP